MSASDMKRDFELTRIAEMETELEVLAEPKVSTVHYSAFVRVGIPILSGLLDGSFNPLLWDDYVGNHHVGLTVLNDHDGSVKYELPPLLAQAPTAINDDPTRESLTAESQHLMNIRDFSPEEVSARLLTVAIETVENHSGEATYGSAEDARKTIDVLNTIFTDHDLDTLPYPKGLENVKVKEDDKVEETKSSTKSKVSEEYDFDQGDDL